jgi:hypothetical protein
VNRKTSVSSLLATPVVTIRCNDRGVALLEFLNSTNLEILNQGSDPTSCNSSRLEVIDITLGSFGFLEIIKGWEVSYVSSLSDHKYILFKLKGSGTERLFRNPMSTNWDSFREDLMGRLEQGPKSNMKG